MRTGLTLKQREILGADVKEASWLFDIDIDNNGTPEYYWSTKAKTWDGHDYTYKIKNFTPITLRKGYPELGILPSNKTTITLTFKDSEVDSYTANDFEGAFITIRLIMKADLRSSFAPGDDVSFEEDSFETTSEQEDEIMSFGFRVVSAISVYQELKLECEDWFHEYLEGDYPNTPLVSHLFPADIMKEDNVCAPVLFGTPYFPIRWITKSGNDYYLLGTRTYKGHTTTYHIDRLRSPKEISGKTEYLASTYTFTQYTLVGSDGNEYRGVKAKINDSDGDNVNDANGIWGNWGKEVYDVPFKYYRYDLSTITNPADIVHWLLENFGVPSAKIDNDSVTTAAAEYTSRGLVLNIGLWYKMPREQLLCKILTLAGMVLILRDKIYFKVLTKTSQLSVEKDYVLNNSFQVSKTNTQKAKDSGYVLWQNTTDPIGQDYGNKSLIAAKSSTDDQSDTTVECEWIDGSDKAKTSGKLALQRILGPDKDITWTGKIKMGLIECGDVITINQDDHGAEGTAYDIQIEEEIWPRELNGIGYKATKFCWALDDWNDLSETTVTVATADTSSAYTSVIQGPPDAQTPSGDKPNQITQTVLIGSNGVIATNENPATNGGFKATNEELTCYNTSGAIRFHVIYSGTDQGDVIIGDYDGNQGIKWDQSETKLNIKVNETGGIEIADGGDVTLTGNNTDPGKIKLQGSSYYTELWVNTVGNSMMIKPGTDKVVTCYLGYDILDGSRRFLDIKAYAERYIYLYAGDNFTSTDDRVYFVLGAGNEIDPGFARIRIDDAGAADYQTYDFKYNQIFPLQDKFSDLGGASNAWDDVYADDFQNVADFYHLDYRDENGEIIPVDDLEVIKNIKPSNQIDERTGLVLIDDNSLPDWLLTRHKGTGEILRDQQGKPFIALKAVDSLLLGATRQLIGKIDELMQKMQQLEADLKVKDEEMVELQNKINELIKNNG